MRLLRANLLLLVTLAVFSFATLAASAQDSGKSNASATGQVKEGGKEMGEAGKSLAKNTKKGHVAKGGKSFGKHVARGSKHVAKGTAKGTTNAAKGTAKVTTKAAKGTTKVVKKAVTP